MGLTLMRGKGHTYPRDCVASPSHEAGPRRVGPIVWLATLGIVLVALAVSACGPKQPVPTDTTAPTETMTQTATADAPPTEPGPAATGELPVTKPTGSSATNLAELAYQFKSNKWHVVSENGTYEIRCQKEPSGQYDFFVFVPKSDGTVAMSIEGTSGRVYHTFASEKEAATSMSYFSRMTCLIG